MTNGANHIALVRGLAKQTFMGPTANAGQDQSMTNTQYNNIDYKHGRADGKNSANMKNPIHKNWSGKHPNKMYEEGYWAGFHHESNMNNAFPNRSKI